MKLTLQVFFLLVFVFQSGYSQERTITGTVTDAGGMPIPGVNVTVRNTNRGAQTDFDGNYSVAASPNEVLVFTFVGLSRVERAVGTASVINITMEEDAQSLDEVVVVGYGVQSKREVTGSISQVKGEEIANLVTPSFESQLAGRAAGVQVTTQSGIVGETPRFRIRGIASITSGTYPLIVVDGIPIFTGDMGGYASSNSLGDINPADIESIEILKDGSATAIYGSRAANGVVLITTKSGKEGKMTINFNSTVGFASPIETFDLLRTSDFVTINNEKRSNRGQADWAAGTQFDTDWQDAVLRSSALQTDYNTSFSGGTANTTYYLSLGYTDQESVARPNGMQRYSMRSNIDQKIKSWLSIGVNAGLTRTEYSGLNTGTNSLSGNIFNATRQHPNVPIYNADHPTGYNIDFEFPALVGRFGNPGLIGDNLPNIMYAIDNNNFTSKVNRIISNVYADIKPISSVNFRTQISIDQANTNGFLYYSPVHGDGQGSNGRVQNRTDELTTWNWQNILSFNEKFADDHNVNITLVNEFQKSEEKFYTAIGTDLSNEFFNRHLISNSFGVPAATGGYVDYGFISYAARANYNFRNKYFLQGTIRRDGLSDLPEANRYGTFPAVSAGWTISEESFMENADFISDFKIRASYGKVGNTNIGRTPYLGLYGAAKYGDANGIGYAQFGNNTLRWETSTKYDVGFDLRMFNNRLTVNADYFLNETDDLILDLETPMSFGVPGNSYRSNIGAIKNSGVELAVEARIIESRDFRWSVNANVSFIENEVTALVNGADRILNNNVNISRVGESINSLYGFRYWGSNPANGNPVYYKADGSLVQGNIPTGNYRVFDPANPSDISQAGSLSGALDRQILGQTMPKYFGGLSSSMTYKSFDLGFLFRFSGGNKIFNNTRRDLLNQNFTNNSTEILGRWQSEANPGDGVTPRLWAAGNTFVNLTSSASTRFIENGDFIKLDNLTLGFTLPAATSQRMGMSKFRVYAQGQNLLIITDYSGLDPEMELAGIDLNGTPRSSIISFGLNIGL